MPVGEVGELIVHGPNVMKGYYKMPEETAMTIRDGWLFTGDLAKVDEEGYFYIVDRKKDMIIVGALMFILVRWRKCCLPIIILWRQRW